MVGMTEHFLKNNNFDSLGKRIQFIRRMAGLSRKSFQEIYHININTLQAWESDRISPRQKSTDSLIEIFERLNIACSREWLLTGKGEMPFIVDSGELAKMPLPIMPDESFLREIDAFKALNPNTIVISVVDSSCKPIYEIGDYVGGIKKSHTNCEKSLGQVCIIGLLDNSILIRKLLKSQNNKFTLIPANPNIFSDDYIQYNIDIDFAAEITWHRRITREVNGE